MNQSLRLLPDAASRSATEVDIISLTLLGITTFFSVAIALAIIFLVARYWHNRDVNRESTSTNRMHWIVELTWSIGPLIILLAVFAWGAALYIKEHRPPSDAIEIYVVGKQWMWKISHQNGRREINSLHVPTGQPVRLTMISEDVIHSFFVPAFRTKRDVLPGRYTTLWFEPTKPGVYHLFCAEYCGTEHSKMIGEVIVQTPQEYAGWLAAEESESLAQRGRRQFEAMGCLQCHGGFIGNESPAVAGPPLTGLYGRTVMLSDGESVIADEAYIRRSLLDPQADVHAGFKPLMPSYDGKLQPEQIMEITAYLKSIADAIGPLAGPGMENGPTLRSQENERNGAEDLRESENDE
ncbi:cytochrome c oxidase subunit II [Novipirellula rosea]|uniref:Cytochrome c oxidase subunit 2 n=1 Tax=Novipirellula rosea TaxID=1031540 RepID=A0ABP8NLY4_9BACT